MSHLEIELQQLNDSITEMMQLVKNQIEKGSQAFLKYDEELAHEIIYNERRVDAMELKIDRDCENILALFNPVAVDLRFVIASFKINAELERLGDHASSIAKYILDFDGPIDPSVIKKMRIDEMYEVAITMVNNVFDAFESSDTQLARKVFRQDEILNEINENATKVTSELIKQDGENIRLYLSLFSIIRKLERVGDLTKNTAEEIIFYIEAKILKHKKKNKK